MRIEYLDQNKEVIPTLAEWLYNQWGRNNPEASVETTIARLNSYLGPTPIPTAFVAMSSETLLGSASLVPRDLDTRKNLSPWLASVYVAPEHRNQGVASALVLRVIEEVRSLGVKTFYLFTPDQEHLYARLGWKVLERAVWRNMDIVVMKYDLTA